MQFFPISKSTYSIFFVSEIAIEAEISQSAARTVNLHSFGNQWRQILFKQWWAVNQIVHSFMNGGLVLE